MSHLKNGELVCSLENIGIFEGLPPAALERIARRCDPRSYEPGEQIIHYQDTSDEVFLLVRGAARVTIYSVDGKAVSFRELSLGDLFGEYPAFDGGPRSASVEALTECLIASMPAASFIELLSMDSRLALRLMKSFVLTIRKLTSRVYEFSTLAVNNRIQAELLRLARSGAGNVECNCIAPAPTHADIASRISTHREAVTRELNRLSKIGIIERRGTTLLIKDINRLTTMVHEATGE